MKQNISHSLDTGTAKQAPNCKQTSDQDIKNGLVNFIEVQTISEGTLYQCQRQFPTILANQFQIIMNNITEIYLGHFIS